MMECDKKECKFHFTRVGIKRVMVLPRLETIVSSCILHHHGFVILITQ